MFWGRGVCHGFALDMPLILIPLGLMYIIEVLSDIPGGLL